MTEQVRKDLKRQILRGILQPGIRLPSTRRLAADIGVCRSVVVEAYEQLIAGGYLDAVPGSGTRVADVADRTAVASNVVDIFPDGRSPRFRWDLRTGIADVANFPRQEWLSCYQRTLQLAGPDALCYPPVTGVLPLRQGLTSYLGRVRGVRTDPAHIMVTAGFAQGLALLCQSLLGLGIDELGVEDPSNRRQRDFIADTGMRPQAVPIDQHGLDVSALAKTGVRAVLVTPAHQFPTGVVMSTERRAALLQWARDVDGWIIEDDYDSELWYDRRDRRPSLQGRDPERVIYTSSTSKVLVPGLRLGWVVTPPHLFNRLRETRTRHDMGGDSLTQLTFAEFLGSGQFDRHLRRSRSRFQPRWEAVNRVVRQHLRDVEVTGSAAGLHAYLRFPPGIDEAALVTGALRRSVLVHGGQRYRFSPQPGAPALVVGFAALPATAVGEATRILADVYADLRRSRPTGVLFGQVRGRAS
ncbi:MAG TPA: PLP-dependent aminotransferase family protein [Pilimelia sp.]|nr:PLP-dependent aminotransferase family protein [Pilimelia sp.]